MKMRVALSFFALLCLFAVAGSQTIGAQPFVHPGCLSTTNDFARMKTKVQAGAHPWVDSWIILTNNSHAQTNYVPNPVPILQRGNGGGACLANDNYANAMNDAAAVYQLALRWKITGDNNYANTATNILNQWSLVCTNLCGDPNIGLLPIYGYEFACGAEIMRDYTNWTAPDLARFQGWMTNQWYPLCNSFLTGHWGTCNTHIWANWDLCNMDCMMAIGVLCDNRAIYNQAINYYKTGVGNGAANQLIYFMHPGYMGQWQEAGRDQGHCTLGPALMGVFCEIAWNQGDDIYGYNTNLFLAGCEYTAKYNVQPLANTVPYVNFCDCNSDIQNVISSASRGSVRPGWDLIFNHYVNRRGLSATYSAQFAAQVRPEGGGGNYGGNSGGFDQLGFTTLTHTLDPIVTNAIPIPTGLRPEVRNNTATISWWGNAYASSYNVKRATASNGPYATIASGLTTNLFYTDVGLLPGTNYFYEVSAVVGGVEGSNSLPVSASADTRLTGAVIGSSGSFVNWPSLSSGATITNVYDNALGSFYDAANVSGDWAGLDLGASNVITQIKYCPRIGYASRMVGGKFQGANVADFSNGVVTLFTIAIAPTDSWPQTLTTQTISSPAAFRYVRYLGPASGSCNVSEVQFFGTPSPASAPVTPTGLNATPGYAQVSLSWIAPANTTSFKIKRALTSGGPFTTVANGITTTTFLDAGLINFTNYFYVVSAVNATGESADSAPVSVMPFTTTLAGYWKFNETSGTNAFDSTSNSWTGTLINGANFVAGYSNNAVSLSSASSQYVTLPPGVVSNLTDFTIATWIYLSNAPAAWSRIFDFGNNTTTYMFLSPKNGANNLIRFAITTGSSGGEQKIDGTATLPNNVWKHVAVTLNGTVGILYVDGVAVGTNSAMTLNPASLGSTALNYLGKSQWADPYLNGRVDEFRIYNSGLSAGELATFLAPLAAPTNFTAINVNNSFALLQWNAAARAIGYNLKRALTNSGPYTLLATVTGTNYSDATLSVGTNYFYVVSTINAVGESANSFSASVRLVSTTPTQCTVALNGGQLQLSWPADHTGWRLQSQTNLLGTNWTTVANSTNMNQLSIPTNATNSSVFFRLIYP